MGLHSITQTHFCLHDDSFRLIYALLLSKAADSTIRDSMHDSDALGWATFFRRQHLAELIERSRRA
jgi:hypothetical protein